MPDRTVSVRLQAIVDQYNRSMADAKSATRAREHEIHGLAMESVAGGRAADRLARDWVKTGRDMQRAGTIITASVSAPLALVARHAIGTAEAAQEATNRMNLAFGDSADAIEEWSSDSARTMGLARHEAFGAASTFKILLDEMGVASDQSATMSTNLVQLAADLGSLHDVDPSEMLVRLSAGLVGEIEPLRRVGVLLTDQATRRKAVDLGLASSTATVSESAKVQARYALILDQSSVAQGDYERTATAATNAQRTANAAWKDAQVELGNNLLPIVAKGALTLTDFLEALQKLPEPVQNLILAMTTLAIAAGPALIVTGTLIRNLETIQKVGPRAAGALSFASWAAAILALGYAFHETFGEPVAEKIHKIADEINNLSTAELVRRFQDGGMSLEVFTGIAERSLGTAIRLRDGLAEAGVDVTDLTAVIDDLSGAAAQAAGDQQLAADAIEGVGAEAEDSSEQVERYTSSLEDLRDAAFGVEAVSDQLTADLADLAQAVRDAREDGDRWATSLDAATESGRANREALRGLVEDGLDLAAALREQGAAESTIATVTAMYRQQLVDLLTQMGFNRAEVERYLSVLGMVPGSINTDITVDDAQALAALARVRSAALEVFALFQDLSSAFGFGSGGGNSRDAAEQQRAIAGTIGSSIGAVSSLPRATSPSTMRPPSGGASASTRDPVREWRDASDANQRRLFEHNQITLEEYDRYLNERLGQERQFSEEWYTLLDEQQRVRDQRAADVRSWNEAIARNEAEAVDRWMTTLRRQYETGARSRESYRQLLVDRLDDLEQYSDDWFATWQEIARLDEQTAREQERADEERTRNREQALDKLNRLLEQEATIRRRLEDLERGHQQRLSDLADRFIADQQRVIDDRQDQLTGWMSIEERFVAGWANSAGALIRNVRNQNDAFTEWADLLAEAQDRGLSSAVIDMLGLDEGPQALAQLRMLSRASQDEIDDLNSAVEDRTALAAGEVGREQEDSFSKLSQTLIGLADRHAAEVEALTEEFLANEQALFDELEQIGNEGGKSFGQAIAAGLRSSIPAIVAAAREAAAAARGASGGPGEGIRSDNPLTKPILGPKLPHIDLHTLKAAPSHVSVAAPNVVVKIGDKTITDLVDVVVDGRSTLGAVVGRK